MNDEREHIIKAEVVELAYTGLAYHATCNGRVIRGVEVRTAA